MTLEQTREAWQTFGERDPLWAVLTDDGTRGNRWDPEAFFATGRNKVAELLQYAQAAGANPRFGRALDFGCGVGRLTQALAERFERVVGVDVAESMIERARSYNRFPDRCTYLVNTTDDLHILESASFDLVLTVIVLQHIEPPYVMRYLGEFVRLLKPGGVLVFQQTSRKRLWLRFPTPAKSFKQRLLRIAPAPILGVYANAKARLRGEPKMNAWGILPEQIVRHIESLGARVLDVTPDDWGGPAWESHHYCVVKPPLESPRAEA